MTFKKLPFTYSPLPLMAAVSGIVITGCSTTSAPAPANSVGTTSTTRPPIFQRTSPVAQTEAVSNVPAAASASYGTSLLDEESLDELANLLEATDMKMVEDDKLAIQQAGNLWDRMRGGFSINSNVADPRIEAQKSWFATRQDYINRLTARASRYLYHTVREAERRNIPTELALLPIIESSYDPTATSNANAAGMWQFIPSTGRIYGLKQTPTYDGRRDVVESTRAAYDFLTSLYNQFGSWELALAAYNAGPGRVQRAIDANEAQGLPTDFWSLNLPKETMSYVPRFLAVAQIVADTDGYSVFLPAIANRQHFRSVPVNYGVSLSEISQLTGVSLEELRVLNPALIAGRVDPSGPNRVIIPNQVNTQLDARLSQIGSGDTLSAYSPNVPDTQYNQMSKSADGLAEFATQARAPQQTSNYIAPASPVRPEASAAQKQAINNQFAYANVLPTTSAALTSNATIIQEPPLSPEEKQFIADQIRQQSPVVGQVVSPVDGNVRLGALQTQQSILAATGQEKRLRFDSPITSNQAAPPQQSRQPQGRRTTYTVQRGDTLSNIATRANLNWRDIADWNQISPNSTLLVGTNLYLYNARPISALGQTATSTESDQSKAQPNTYVVRPGDTLIGTANRVGLSVSSLAKYNGLSTNARLKSGQKLWLVPGRVEATKTTSTSSDTSGSSKYTGETQRYTVKKGESLIGLANRFNISVSKFAAMNDLSPTEELLIGQRLQVPADSVTTQSTSSPTTSSASASTYKGPTSSYEVQSGDTLIGLANRFNASRTIIAELNGLSTNSRLQLGQTIKLPVSSTQIAVKSHNSSSRPSSYEVTSGDTLIGLANKFGVSVSNFAAANNLNTTSELRIGQRLVIPGEGSQSSADKTTPSTSSSEPTYGQRYTVKSGDSLIGLASRYNVPVSSLASVNGLSATTGLQIGQKIKVPNNASVATPDRSSTNTVSSSTSRSSDTNYTVRSGDSLIGLASKNGLTPETLAKANGISSNANLKIGQRLTIPATTTKYKVRSGDSLIRLAKKSGMSTADFAKLNGISSDTRLQRGQVVTVPVQ